MNFKILVKSFFVGAIALSAAPSKAITTTAIFNGTATYACGNPANCTITATNFSLNFDGANWSSGYSPNGTLFLDGAQAPANNTALFSNNNGIYFLTTSDDPNAVNNSTAFTVSPGPIFNPATYFTFYLTSTPAAAANQGVFLYAIGSPETSSSNLRPTNGYAVLSSTIYGQSVPAPLGLLALFPFFRLIKRRIDLAPNAI